MNKNILLDELPQYVNSGLQIRTDFRESIKFELLMQDKNLSKEVKVMQALQLYYYEPNKIKDVKKAIDNILWFYKCGKTTNKSNSDDEEETQERTKQIYSYEFDDEYIFSAFLEQYGIDLNEIKYMHWWKFKALFNSLSENTQFVKIISYRNMNIAKIKNKEMKSHYKKMQELYKLPDMRSDEEKESDFANELW